MESLSAFRLSLYYSYLCIMADEGFKIEVTSRYEGWWRYNVALMCGCFDAADQRIGFASASLHIADAGANLEKPPAEHKAGHKAVLETQPCDRLQLYIYIIPHTLPRSNDIDDTQPFEVEIALSKGARKLKKHRCRINQWSGASIELRVGQDG